MVIKTSGYRKEDSLINAWLLCIPAVCRKERGKIVGRTTATLQDPRSPSFCERMPISPHHLQKHLLKLLLGQREKQGECSCWY